MISRLKDENNNEGIAIIVDSDYLEYENNPYCPNCREIGKISRLKERLYMDENGKRSPPPPDADDWLQCWKCGLIIPIREAKMQGKISGISGVELIDNPYDFNKKFITGLGNKKDRYLKLQKRKVEKSMLIRILKNT